MEMKLSAGINVCGNLDSCWNVLFGVEIMKMKLTFRPTHSQGAHESSSNREAIADFDRDREMALTEFIGFLGSSGC